MVDEDEDFAAMLDASLSQKGDGSRKLRQGQSVQGTVLQIGKDTIFVDVGTRSEAEIDRHQLTDRDGVLTVQVGDRIRATVAQGGDRPKLVIKLGKGGVNLASLELAQEAGTPVDGTVSKAVKGGLEIDLAGMRAFCPASQIDRTFVKDLSIYEGQDLRFKIMEIRDGGRSIVVSRRALLDQEREAMAAEVLSSISEGAVLDGTVQSIQSYGAFVDLGGVEGLVHISELGHGRVASVQDVVSVGEKIKVKVMAIEEVPQGNGVQRRIKLSMRAAGPAPAGGGGRRGTEAVLDGTVTKVEPFGVFVSTEAGEGLVPSRELGLPHGGDPRRAFPEGKEVRVVPIGEDPQGRPRYSIRKVEDAEARAAYREFKKSNAPKKKGGMGSFGALLAEKLGDSADSAPAATATAGAGKAKSGKRRKV